MAATDTTTTDIVISDEAEVAEDSSTDSFGKQITKTLAISAATTAGMYGAMFVIGYASGKVQQFRATRAAKKNEPVVHVVTDLPTPETETN